MRVSVTEPAAGAVRVVERGRREKTRVAGEVDWVKLVSPLYWAVTTTSPTGKEVAV